MKERITLRQVLCLVVSSRLALTLIYYGTDPEVGQDLWWESFLDAGVILLAAWVLSALWRRYPGKTLAEVLQTVLGRFVGSLLGVLYAAVVMLNLCLTLRLAGEVFVLVSLPGTPVTAVMVILAGLSAWTVRSGIEVLGRATEVILPLLLGTVVVVFVIVLPVVHFDQLLPLELLTVGPWPHLRSALGVMSRTVELISVAMIVPHVSEPKKLLRTAGAALCWLAAAWVLIAVPVLGVLGELTTAYPFPWLMAIRSAAIIEFFERMDGLVLGVWVLGIFVRVSFLLWTAAVAVAQGLRLREHRPLVPPLAAMAVSGAVLQAESLMELLHGIRTEVFTPFMLIFMVLIPAGLVAISWVQGLRRRGHAHRSGSSPAGPSSPPAP
jgi:spore germination protein KB